MTTMEEIFSTDRLLSLLSSSIDYLRSVELREDTVTSIYAGIGLGVGIIVFLSIFPGEPFDYNTGTVPPDPRGRKDVADPASFPESEAAGFSTSVAGSTGKKNGLRNRKENAAGTEIEMLKRDADPDRRRSEELTVEDPFSDNVIEKSRKLAKIFNLDDEQFEKAVTDAKQQYRDGKSGSDSSGEITAFMNLIIPVALAAALFYVLNRDYGGAGTYWLTRLFPRETATLGFSNTGAQ